MSFDLPPARDDKGVLRYLNTPLRFPSLTLVLVLFAAEQGLSAGGWVQAPLLLLWAATIVALARTAPRRHVYLLVTCATLLIDAQRVLVQANGPQDRDSDRDESAEQACRALLSRRDPWGEKTPLQGPMTTGPASVVLVSPWVALFGEINGLSLAFWAAVLAALLGADMTTRNGSYAPLALLQAAGAFGMGHVQYWSLDELFYPFVLLALGAALLRRQQPMAAGALASSAALWRLNFVPVAIAFALWAARETTVIRFALGVFAGAILILSPFGLVPAASLGEPFQVGWSFLKDGDSGILALLARALGLGAAAGAALKVALGGVLLILLLVLVERRRWSHPFAHLTVAGWVAHAIVWHSATDWPDYVLMITLPAMLWLASEPFLVETSAARNSGPFATTRPHLPTERQG